MENLVLLLAVLLRYLMIECEDPEPNVKHDARVREMYLVVMKKFLQVIIIARADRERLLWPDFGFSSVV